MMIIKINHQPSGGKEWVAEITGRHPKYKFEGKIYEVNEPWKGRRFVTLREGEVVTLPAEEVIAGLGPA